MLVIAESREDTEHRFGHSQNFGCRQEFVQKAGRCRQNRGPAPRMDAEPAAAVPSEHRAEPDVVDGGGNVIDRAAFERDLELTRQRRAQGMTQQIAGQRLGVWRDVEPLVSRDAGIGTRRDIAHRVAAGLTRRESGVRKTAHRRLDVVELHEVELHVLPCRDVAVTAGIGVADVRQRGELIRRQHPLGNLDPHHLDVAGLPLAVGAAHEAELTPLVGGDIAALEAIEGRHEFVDVGLAGKRQPGASMSRHIIDN